MYGKKNLKSFIYLSSEKNNLFWPMLESGYRFQNGVLWAKKIQFKDFTQKKRAFFPKKIPNNDFFHAIFSTALFPVHPNLY